MRRIKKPAVRFKKPKAVCLKLLFYCFKILGIAPFNFETRSIIGGRSIEVVFTPSRYNLIYNLLFAFGVGTANYYGISMMVDGYHNEYRYPKLVVCMQVVLAASNILILITASMQHSMLPAILNQMVELKKIIMNSNTTVVPDKLSKKRILLSLTSYLLSLYPTFNLIFDPSESKLQWILMYAFKVVKSALMLQYSIILRLFKHLLECINKRLLVLSTQTNPIVRIGSALLGSERECGMHTFAQLQNSYTSMCKIAKELSNYYSFFMLFYLISKLYSCTYLTYCGVMIIGKEEFIFQDTIHLVFCLLHVLDCIFSLVLLTSSVSAIDTEKQRTAEIIKDFLNKPQSLEMKEKLQQFFMYLLLGDMKFTVFDWFTLDGTLLVSIAGSITTYVVILLQFN